MRFKGFILDEMKGPTGGRGKTIEADEARDLILTKCTKAVKEYMTTGNTLYRGMPNKGEYYTLDPKSSARRSQYTENYYTLVFDNDPRWKSYPKRSLSVINTTDYGRARGYGALYNVFVYDGSTYGVCPEYDIWDSFSATIPNNMYLGDVNDGLKSIANRLDIVIPEDNYKGFISAIKQMSDALSKGNDPIIGGIELYRHWKKKGTFYDYIMNMYDPKKNGFFATKDISQVFTTGKRTKEVWTSGKCVLVWDRSKIYLSDLLK